MSDTNLVYIGVGVVVLLVLVLLGSRLVSGGSQSAFKTPGLDKLVERGEFAKAAEKAAARENFEEAVALYRRAGNNAYAARLARRAGMMKVAAELYEMEGEKKSAATCWERAGEHQRAEMLRGEVEKAGESQSADAAAAAGEAFGPHDVEVAFRRALAEAKGVSDLAHVQELAATTAEALLDAGEIRRAAGVLKDAKLYDDAVHLYVNVLGSPGEAAPILAANGHRERAAELYEMAGELERAASEWVEVAKDSDRPEQYLDRIEELDQEVAYTYLLGATKAQPLTSDTAELHYRLAQAHERKRKPSLAQEIWSLMLSELGPYRDVQTLLDASAALVASGQVHEEDAISMPPVGAGKFDQTSTPRLELSDIELRTLVSEAAKAAVEQIRNRENVLGAVVKSAGNRRQTRRQRWYDGQLPTLMAVGIEEQPIKLSLIVDTDDGGSTVEELMAFVSGNGCDLGNIEVFYRLGLAYSVEGQWLKALLAFDAVEETSPGYRDADQRADEIRAWRQAMGGRRTSLGLGAGGQAAANQKMARGTDVGMGARASASANTVTAVGNADPAQAASVGRYEILGELGRGGMAVVYRARDQVLDRDVALKFMADEVSQRADLASMFQREAKAVAALNHPGIVTVFDYGKIEGRAFICMELVDGAPVDEVQDELTVVEALRISVQALEALEYAHRNGIIHRDIKPANIMRTRSGLVKLMDFGLAKPLSSKGQASIIAGTPAFMAPEQLVGKDADARVDVFAMGVTIYELLTQELPYNGLDRDTPPRPLRTFTPTLPQILDDAVLKALEPNADNRWESAAAFAKPLKGVLKAVQQYAPEG